MVNNTVLFSLSDPFMLPHMQVDKGAIKFVLSGANIMCPGLTSPGARMTKVEENTIVVSLYNFAMSFKNIHKYMQAYQTIKFLT